MRLLKLSRQTCILHKSFQTLVFESNWKQNVCHNLPAKQTGYSSTIVTLVTYCCIYYRILLKGKLCRLLNQLYAISIYIVYATKQYIQLFTIYRLYFHIFVFPASTHRENRSRTKREGRLNEIRSSCNEVELIRYEPRFCYSPKIFSEAHFSALFL